MPSKTRTAKKMTRTTALKKTARKVAKKGAQKAAPKAAQKVAKKSAKKAAPKDPLERLRAICLALPEAHEVEAWGSETFRVKNKLFAMFVESESHHAGGRPGVWINCDHVTQDFLIRAKPALYFKPPYVGPSGWVGAWLDGRANWAEISELLREGYRSRAPKKLADLVK